MNQKILEGDFSTNNKASAFFNAKRYTLFPFVKRYLLDSLTAKTFGTTSAGNDENRPDSKPMFFVIPLPSISQKSEPREATTKMDTPLASSNFRDPSENSEQRTIPYAKRSRSNFSNPKRMRRLLNIISHIPSLFFAPKRKADTNVGLPS